MMRICKMTPDDLDQVMAIETTAFKDPWRRSFFLSDLSRSGTILLVAKIGSKVIGYIDAWLLGDELHLANIAVDQEFRRRGVGTKLIKKIMAIGRQQGAKYIILEVRRSNIGAQMFYEKLGFYHFYTRPRYYSNGEDALIYKLDL
ncbi:MAG: ribosomal protein S18-alanine N-acetyltransferase [candidate division WOR-3 bacterium]